MVSTVRATTATTAWRRAARAPSERLRCRRRADAAPQPPSLPRRTRLQLHKLLYLVQAANLALLLTADHDFAGSAERGFDPTATLDEVIELFERRVRLARAKV